VTVHQDAALYATLLAPGDTLDHRFRGGFKGYLFVVHGSAYLTAGADAGELDEGGAAKIAEEQAFTVRGMNTGAELLLVETRGEDPGS